MLNELQKIENDILTEISKAGSVDDLEKIKVNSIGRKGSVTDILKKLSGLPVDERKLVGEKADKLRGIVEAEIDKKVKMLKAGDTSERLRSEKIDVSGRLAFPFSRGHSHPLIETLDSIVSVFKELGFDVAIGPEMETELVQFRSP